ncbi:hypothetical protein [Endozoicomonas ascidiicola]|uniref:hypothetical protein n=1 Tax=Endozoicomonas ascidiicola TaxID=1698521 RepID=UPI00082F779D|nr:hypothetical protein [Endozoicomonas ascidiicola]
MTYTEDLLVEQSAINLFESMNWETAVCWDEVFGDEGTFGRDNRTDVILFSRLQKALKKVILHH